jgi:mediator of RNA polymerase II transcription subunit 23
LDRGVSPQGDSLLAVLRYIFDRNSALLPGYFIVNEILKSYPETKTWPHWRLVDLVSDFLDSFRPAASIVSCANKWRLVPVVEQLGRAHVLSTWKLDPASLKFLLKGTNTYERILPYCRELTQPQPHLVKYLLSQPYSKDLVNHVLGLQKPRKDSAPATGRCV